MHPKKMESILNLSPEDRYGYLIRTVADSEVIWLISDNGKYVTLGDKDGRIIIPVWPEKEFADLFLKDDWSVYSSEALDAHEFISWLDDLEEDGTMISGFPSVELNSVVVTADEIKNHLIYELDQYE